MAVQWMKESERNRLEKGKEIKVRNGITEELRGKHRKKIIFR
jgi:hypothetical protein